MSPPSQGLFIRMAQPSDTDDCRAIDIEAWGEASAATVEMMQSRITRYAFGNFVAIDRATGKIVGSVWTTATDMQSFNTWWEASGQGTYESICNPYGDLVIGVNLSVRPDYAGHGVGKALAVRGIEAAWTAGKSKLVLGSRIPHFHKWQHTFSVEDYVRLLGDGESTFFRDPVTQILHAGPTVTELRAHVGLIDPRTWPVATEVPLATHGFDGELAFFMDIRVKGQPCCLYRPLPGYFPDPPSCDYGVLIGWENPDHIIKP